MRKIFILLTLAGTFLTSCGGGQVSDVIHAATVSRDILMRCVALPTSVDEILLGCLSGKISFGIDSSGNECSVRFSSDRLNISSKNFTQDVLYQPVTNSGSKSNTYLYEKSYSSGTGDLSFSVTGNNAGVPYFSFSFSSNANSGSGTAAFGFRLAPEIPGAPGVVLQCTMQI
jgi:hypothetical protein